jgi:hypothetical protein
MISSVAEDKEVEEGPEAISIQDSAFHISSDLKRTSGVRRVQR